MKYSNLAAFEKHLEGASPNHFSDVYMVIAKEAFIRKKAIDRLIFLVTKGESSELTTQIFDADKQDINIILSELETLSFFTKKRVVIIQNATGLDKSSTLKLEAYFSSPNRTVCLVLSAETVNRATTFYKKAEKIGVLLDIPDEKPWEKEKTIVEWLRTEAIVQGRQMSSETCLQLVKQLGTDQATLNSELQKLICYIGERKMIAMEDVSAICGTVNHDNGWQLGEAIFRRDVSSAMRISKALLAEGVALIALLRQIRSQFQTEYQICSIIAQGGSASDVSQEFSYMKGMILDRHINQAQNYGMGNFKKGLLAIDETELQAKNSGLDADLLAEMLIIKLSI